MKRSECDDPFCSGWNVAAIKPDRVQTRYHDDGAPAWFATIKRIQIAGLGPGDVAWPVRLSSRLISVATRRPS
jgi:hypothetical protein